MVQRVPRGIKLREGSEGFETKSGSNDGSEMKYNGWQTLGGRNEIYRDKGHAVKAITRTGRDVYNSHLESRLQENHWCRWIY